MSESKTYTVSRQISANALGASCEITAISTVTDSLGQPVLRITVATKAHTGRQQASAIEEALVQATDLLHAALAAQDDLWVLAEDGAQA